MIGENSPPGEYSPPKAGANNSVRHLCSASSCLNQALNPST